MYEATTLLAFRALHVELCHECLVRFRAVAKKEFKRSLAEKPKPQRPRSE